MTRIFKVLSALLSYPDEQMQEAALDLWQVLAHDQMLPKTVREQLEALIEELAIGDIYDLQERYILLFDRTRSLSLHLFEHVHGESRDRGQAMIDLKNLYEQHGLSISATELPDYLPLFLEFLSTRPLVEASELLGQTAHILSAFAERMHKRNAPYEAVFRAMLALTTVQPDARAVESVLQEPDSDPSDLAALDQQWEDEPVSFGPDASSSCKDRLIARIRAGRRPAANLPA